MKYNVNGKEIEVELKNALSIVDMQNIVKIVCASCLFEDDNGFVKVDRIILNVVYDFALLTVIANYEINDGDSYEDICGCKLLQDIKDKYCEQLTSVMNAIFEEIDYAKLANSTASAIVRMAKLYMDKIPNLDDTLKVLNELPKTLENINPTILNYLTEEKIQKAVQQTTTKEDN